MDKSDTSDVWTSDSNIWRMNEWTKKTSEWFIYCWKEWIYLICHCHLLGKPIVIGGTPNELPRVGGTLAITRGCNVLPNKHITTSVVGAMDTPIVDRVACP